MMLRIVAVSIAIIAVISTAHGEFTKLFGSGGLFLHNIYKCTRRILLNNEFRYMNISLKIKNIELLTLIRLSKKGSFVEWTVMIFKSIPQALFLVRFKFPRPSIALLFLFSAKKFKVTVHTGGRTYAGTDAKVHITLYGKSSKCGPLRIDDPKDNFEANA